jgi:hypothetical protein
MTITLTPEIETAITKQAQKEGVAPEHLAMDGLRSLFLPPKMTPDQILNLAAQVYAGLSEKEIADVEKIALDRSNFIGQRQSF